ncbi:uncharacterized protein L201_007423 [Kwoniella dendrophila CBS 6074]|uniref:Uncharacterized protein n=1 Tax=Kwoniella dendrophila CBS 6074 TaxID=1295534 RepID=A0AAX4K6N0_9TREE
MFCNISSSSPMSESTFSRPTYSISNITPNRKRTASTSEKKNPLNRSGSSSGRRTPSDSGHSNQGSSTDHHQTYHWSGDVGGKSKKKKEKKQNVVDQNEIDHYHDKFNQISSSNGSGSGMEKAPSLNVDIRNSLMLPSLSQRFSVLLPSLSTAPEESLRSLLASQRARVNGPALTEEEEELLFAEMRDAALDDQWDGRPPQINENTARTGLTASPFKKKLSGSGISSSFSSPSLLTTSPTSPSTSTNFDDTQYQNYGDSPSTPSSLFSSPPTSNSFSSFRTFGVGSSPEASSSVSPTGAGSAFKTKSYGFSGGSGMREAEYIRRIKKSVSHKDVRKASTSSANSTQDGNVEGSTPTRGNIPLPPAISPEKANAYYQATKKPESPTNSEKTATPTSSVIPNISASSLPKMHTGHSRASSLNFTPSTPNSAESVSFAAKQQKSRKRQSRLDGLTPAQVKRISLALQEIGGQLKRGSMTVQALPDQSSGTFSGNGEDVEEMLDFESRRATQLDDNEDDDINIERLRRPSDLRSEISDSGQSVASSVFPFQMSPTNSTFTGNGIHTEPSSPTTTSRLPPSPRTHNLLAHVAHVEEPLPPIPMPVFTPTKSQPVRSYHHQPTLSNSSTSTISATNNNGQSVYIPGQPRPVRLTHHSQSSTSSRSATPSNQSPLDAIRAAVSPEHTPSPLRGMPEISARTTSLIRSKSVNQSNSTPTKIASSHVNLSGNRRRAGTIGDAPMERRSSSALSSHPSTPDIIEEDDEPTSDQDNNKFSPPIQSDEYIPEVKQVSGRRSVANSRSVSQDSIHQLHHNLGWELAPGGEPLERTVSAQGTIDDSDVTPPNEHESRTTDPRRRSSTSSTTSSFSDHAQPDSEIGWANVIEKGPTDSLEAIDSDDLISPESIKEADILRKMSGMGLEEMMLLQEKLVIKAKAEREALRGDTLDSPMVPYSPPASAEAFSPSQRAMSPVQRAASPILARPISPPPPSSWRFPPSETVKSSSQNTTPSQERTTLPSSVDTHILTPPLTGSSTGGSVSRSGSKSGPVILPTRAAPAPPPPVETPSEAADEILTPPSADISRKSSGRAYQRRPLEQDPEVRRDFEARIAAATAALNRTPSMQQHQQYHSNSGSSKLDRKFSKKGGHGGPMIISSPKLVSSTAVVPTTPLTPENQNNTSVNTNKSVDKSSGGPGSKMSLKWKKFTGLRSKGPSFSGNEVTQPQRKTSPNKNSSQQQQQLRTQQSKLAPIQNPAIAQGGLQRSASASVAQTLEDPITLKENELIENPPPSAPPNLDAFKFPPPPERHGSASESSVQQDLPSPPSSLGHSSGLRNVMSKMKRSKDVSPPPQQTQNRSQSPIPASNRAMSPLPTINAVVQQPKHTPTASEDDARNKFIEAGRALGLSEDQLNDMLKAKGMTGTVASAPQPSSMPSPPPTATTSADEPIVRSAEKEKKGLFRSLSKARKAQASPVPDSSTVLAPSAPIPEPARTTTSTHDRVVVRRTMILPEGLNIIPSTPQVISNSNTPSIPESPDSNSLRPGVQSRKQSIRRKPLQLSKEDHELVSTSNSPPAHARKFSFSNQSGKGSLSDSTGANTPTRITFGTNTPSPSNSQNQVPTINNNNNNNNEQSLQGLGFLHPNTPLLNKKSSIPTLTPSPGNDSLLSDNDSHARSSTGGSLIDMYRNTDNEDEEEEMLESPQKKLTNPTFNDLDNDYEFEDPSTATHSRRASEDVMPIGRGSMDDMNRRRMTQAVEITEYADGQVIWNIVDALRTSVTGSIDGEEYTFDNSQANPHSRSTSYSSSVRNSIIPEDGDVFKSAGNNAGWPKGLGNGTAGLNFRHRDRNATSKPRPPTDVYFTSHRDVADLIDHLSRDLDASHGRIDIISHSPPNENDWRQSNSSPFVFQDSAIPTIPTTPERSIKTRSLISQFEDAPSPAQNPIRPFYNHNTNIPSPIDPAKANNFYGNMEENLSGGSGSGGTPHRQLFAESYLDPNSNSSRGQSFVSSNNQMSPSNKSFTSSMVSNPNKSVEDRLQALLDRLKGDGIGKTRL